MQLDTILADRYQIHEQLSSKAGRQTFLAQDLQSQDLVIIKVLRFGASFQWDDLKLFEREALTLKNLAHPAIPQYLDYFELDLADLRGFALVQTYLPAPSLETVVREGRSFSEQDVTEIADRLLSILTYLHEQNPPVIHRDIKPSNILLSNRSAHSVGDVYLVDFGSVQTSANKDGGTITIVGSYGYMPLEQFGGQTRAASDLYSLGMTLIYLLTGYHPAELIDANGEIRFDRSDLSDQFSRWLDKMIQSHLDKRFDSAKLAQTILKSSDYWQEDLAHQKPILSTIKVNRGQDILEIEFQKIILPSKKSNDEALNAILYLGSCAFILGMQAAPLGIFVFVVLYFLVFLSVILFPLIQNSYTNRKAIDGESLNIVFHLGLFIVALIAIQIAPLVSLVIFVFWPLVYLSMTTFQLIKSSCISFKFISISKKTRIFKKSNHHSIKQKNFIERKYINSRAVVGLLTYYPGTDIPSAFDDQEVEQHEVTTGTLPELSIHVNKKEYVIAGRQFSAEELYWLGQEISNFLDLPLQIIN
jgi:serine/threonine protein kinase